MVRELIYTLEIYLLDQLELRIGPIITVSLTGSGFRLN